MNKKDDGITLLEFRRVKNYPVFSRLSLLFGFLLGIIAYYFTSKIFVIFALTGIGVILYIYFAVHYRCPDCNGYLWYLKDKSKIKRCPNCQAMLREGPARNIDPRRTRTTEKRKRIR